MLALLVITVSLIAFSSVAALASAGKQVQVQDWQFSSSHLTIHRGSKVTWKWMGVLVHNVTVRKGPAKFRSRTQVRGSFSHVFATKGVYSLYCTLHPRTMKMTVVVN
jgi:plastocyanin